MKYFQLFIIAVFFTFSLASNAFPIPDDNEVSFDVIRKNKVIGNLTTKFIKDDENIVLHSVLDINIKILFIPAYKFFQETKETWRNGEFISIDGFTDFETGERVESVKNRLLLFDGSIPHSSSTPTNTKERLLLSVTYI